MAEEKVEHHYHEPTQGQVTKAMYQYLSDLGIDQNTLTKIVEQKIEKVLGEKLEVYLKTGKFDKLLTDLVAGFVKRTRDSYKEHGYSYTDHIRDLVQHELRFAVLDQYEITIRPKNKEQACPAKSP